MLTGRTWSYIICQIILCFILIITMGYKCGVLGLGCKSNYDSESKDGNQKSVSTFGFPKDEQIRQQ